MDTNTGTNTGKEMIKPNNIIAADFVEYATEPLTFFFDGQPSTKEEIMRVLRNGIMFENGIVRNDGNDYWFSGTLEGQAFTLVISGANTGRKIQTLGFEQFR